METRKSKLRLRLRKSPFAIVTLTLLVIFISVTALFVAFYYNVYTVAVQQETVNTQRHELTTSVGYCDSLFDVVLSMSESIATSHNVLCFGEAPKDYALYHRIIDELLAQKSSLSTLNSIWTVFADHNVVLTSNEGYYKASEDFYDQVWTEYDDYLSTFGHDTVITAPRMIHPYAMNDMQVVSLIRRQVRAYEDHTETIYVVINLNFNRVLDALNMEDWISESARDELLIVDSANDRIYDPKGLYQSIPPEILPEIAAEPEYRTERIGSQQYLCIAASSKKLPWHFLRMTSTDEVYLASAWLMRVVWISEICFLIAVVLFAYTLVKKIQIPYRRMLRQFGSGDRRELQGDGMDYIERMLVRSVSMQYMLTETYLEHALLYAVPDSKAGDEQGAIRLGSFILLVVHHENPENPRFTMFADKASLLDRSAHALLESQRDALHYSAAHLVHLPTSMALIVELHEAPPMSQILRCCELLRQSFLIQNNYPCTIAASRIHCGTEQLHTAFLQARAAMEIHYFFSSVKICFYDQLESYRKGFFTINQVKTEMFINTLQNKRYAQANDVLESIVADIRKALERNLLTNLPNYLSSLLNQVYIAAQQLNQQPLELFGSVITTQAGELFDNWNFQTMEETIQTLQRMIGMLEDKYGDLQEQMGADERSRNVSLTVRYIETNYAQGISLSEIAEQLSIDESYLSKQFKEKMGCSFVQYTTRFRIARAKELLTSTHMNLTEIAETLGLGNAQNFIRTFKKYEGVTPGRYRKMTAWSEELPESQEDGA